MKKLLLMTALALVPVSAMAITPDPTPTPTPTPTPPPAPTPTPTPTTDGEIKIPTTDCRTDPITWPWNNRLNECAAPIIVDHDGPLPKF